jgi:hypothetical protein
MRDFAIEVTHDGGLAVLDDEGVVARVPRVLLLTDGEQIEATDTGYQLVKISRRGRTTVQTISSVSTVVLRVPSERRIDFCKPLPAAVVSAVAQRVLEFTL